MPRLDPVQRPGTSLGLGPDRRSLGRADQVGPRQDDHAGAPQRADRLAEQAAREQMPQPERLERIEQHHVEVARQPPMLKPVVEHDQLGLELVRRRSCASATRSAILKMGDVGQVLLEDPALVVQSLGLAVAAAQDRDPQRRGGETSGRPTRPSASCRFRRASGSRPKRPARRRGGLAASPDRSRSSARRRPRHTTDGRQPKPRPRKPRPAARALWPRIRRRYASRSNRLKHRLPSRG